MVNAIIERINKKQFWKFHGGIHPPEQKFITNEKPIRPLTLPPVLSIPVQQHIGQAGSLIVKAGDYVLKGQPLTAPKSPMSVPIHAPTSGTITEIKNTTMAHPSAMQGLSVFLTPDGEDKWRERHICDDFYSLPREEIITKIANAGISGMGGAGFPTHIKVDTKPAIDFLIINAAECEPYITADDLLMREYASVIVDGIKILDHLLLPEYILIGIEDNKPEAIQALEQATKDLEKVKICVVPTKYPTGGEKQLIKILTGKEVPSGSIPGQLGIVMHNVATCFAIAEAVIHDIPLLRRVVTVTGQALEKPQNIWSLLGTPVDFLLQECGYQADHNNQLIMGGPMMGFSMPSTKIPIVKTTNCILVPSTKEISSEQKEVECIRCGQCAEVCPSQLLPQELQWSAKAKDYDQLKALNLFDCIDCGACAYVCPSHIPLVQYYRVAKAEIRHLQMQEVKAEKAKSRFEARKARLEREKLAREEKHKKAAEARRAKMNAQTPEAQGDKSAVAAALARVKAKKAAAQTDEQPATKPPSANPAVAAAVARAKAKKAAKQAEANNDSSVEEINEQTLERAENTDRVAAAIARAKAKKAAKAAQAIENSSAQTDDQSDENKTETADDKKARVAAAVAKAKAKKTKQAKVEAAEVEIESKPEAEVETENKDDKKARIAAAVAKAKAKKLAEKSKSEKTEQPPSDENSTGDENVAAVNETSEEQAPLENDKKARIAAAVAKAKAKKLAEKSKSEDAEAEQPTSDAAEELTSVAAKAEPEVDVKQAEKDKKARIAAAVAKAKAKKAAQDSEEQAAAQAPDQPLSPEEEKKKRIAAAIAKAKAKKQVESK